MKVNGTTSDYASARCAAITKSGRRCSGRWGTAVPILFSHDAVTGDGTDGPWCVLCHRHRWWTHEKGVRTGRRFPVVHGWLGAANEHGYGTAVYAAESGRQPAAWWWERRRPSPWGGPGRKDAA